VFEKVSDSHPDIVQPKLAAEKALGMLLFVVIIRTRSTVLDTVWYGMVPYHAIADVQSSTRAEIFEKQHLKKIGDAFTFLSNFCSEKPFFFSLSRPLFAPLLDVLSF
jgi:hypothetical protein